MTRQRGHQHRIILFCKVPSPGQVKTRLIPYMGADAAAALQSRLLTNICGELNQITSGEMALSVQVEIRFDGGSPEEMRALVGNEFLLVHQGEGHLGQRMGRAVTAAFEEGISRVVVIGADVPELSSDVLRAALLALRQWDVVIGPTEDGGYYLLGLNAPQPSLFEHVSFGSDAVFAETLGRIQSASLTYHILPMLYDVDRPADVDRWLERESL